MTDEVHRYEVYPTAAAGASAILAFLALQPGVELELPRPPVDTKRKSAVL